MTVPVPDYLTAPDGTVTLTEPEWFRALESFERMDWSTLPVEITPEIRKAAMAGCIGAACGYSKPLTRHLYDHNAYFRLLVVATLDVFDMTRNEEKRPE